MLNNKSSTTLEKLKQSFKEKRTFARKNVTNWKTNFRAAQKKDWKSKEMRNS